MFDAVGLPLEERYLVAAKNLTFVNGLRLSKVERHLQVLEARLRNKKALALALLEVAASKALEYSTERALRIVINAQGGVDNKTVQQAVACIFQIM